MLYWFPGVSACFSLPDYLELFWLLLILPVCKDVLCCQVEDVCEASIFCVHWISLCFFVQIPVLSRFQPTTQLLSPLSHSKALPELLPLLISPNPAGSLARIPAPAQPLPHLPLQLSPLLWLCRPTQSPGSNPAASGRAVTQQDAHRPSSLISWMRWRISPPGSSQIRPARKVRRDTRNCDRTSTTP